MNKDVWSVVQDLSYLTCPSCICNPMLKDIPFDRNESCESVVMRGVLTIESLAAELEQVTRERDAAVEDLKKNSYTPCATCGKRIDNKSCTEFGERMPCDMINIFRCEMYEWRGAKED